VAAGYRAGRIPVLRPDSPARARRFAEVLDWYGPTAPTHAGSADLLACVNAADWPVVEAFAELTGRPGVRFDPAAGPVPDALRTAASVTIVGRDTDFPMATLQRLARELDRPWGLLPAPDPAGLTFVLAKWLADGGRADLSRWAVVDAIGGTARSYRDPETALDQPAVAELLTGRDWDVLALCAHGENGHCNLGSHVLCGVMGEQETTWDGVPLRGCGKVGGVRTCKRRRGDAQVLWAAEIRARRLLLFSCTNFSVAGDLFPSNVSLITAALDGYASCVLSCDRALPLTPAAAWSLTSAAVGGAAPGTLRDLENDHHDRATAAHPYFLAGDPGGPATPIQPLTPDTDLLPAGAIPMVIGEWPAADEAVLVDPPDASVVRGRRYVRVVTDQPVRISSAGAAWHAHCRWARDLDRRLADAARLTRAIHDLAPNDSVPRLAAALRAAERLAHGVARTAETAVRAGVWQPMLDRAPAVAARVTEAWDAVFVANLAAGLLQHNAFEQVLVDGSRRERVLPAAPCDYCGSPTYRAEHAGGRGVAADFTHCPHCGPKHYVSQGMPAARVELSERVLPGRPVRLRVVLPAELAGAHLLAQFKDNGRNELWWSHHGVLDAGGTDFAPRPPLDAAADLMTLRIVLVHGLAVSYHRLRRPCLATATRGD
jgi:hypothetical protein